jgi:hypothetical protein
MPQVVIGCRLPHGLTLRHPNPEVKQEFKLPGIYSSKIVNRNGSPAAMHTTTMVDADFWEVWKTAYRGYKPLTTGAVFEARNETEAGGKAKELNKEKTGFEALLPESMGVKKADKD